MEGGTNTARWGESKDPTPELEDDIWEGWSSKGLRVAPSVVHRSLVFPRGLANGLQVE